MSLYDDLLGWSRLRPLWQRDGLRRLVVNGPLTQSDVADLAELALIDAGLPSSGIPPAAPLASEHLPTGGVTHDAVTLDAIASPTNVNALPPDARLEFDPRGLTLIYGDNGSGKSGYVRILKRVCRARGTPERVLPNVLKTDMRAPTANVEYRVGEARKSHPWSDGGAEVHELAAVTVFDRACAAVYVNSENEVAYRPLGLDLLDALARAAVAVRGQLEVARRASSTATLTPPQSVLDSPVLREVWPPRHTNTKEAVAKIAAWSPQAAQELDGIDRALAAPAVSESIAGVAARKAALGRALRACSETLDAAQAAGRLRAVVEDHRRAEAALSLAREADAVDLPGVGGSLWRALWAAAERYSTEEAYPGHEFPSLDPGAHCVLCGQTISDGARARFQALRKLVDQELAVAATEAANDVSVIRDRLARHVSESGAAAVLGDLHLTDDEAAASLAAFVDWGRDVVTDALAWFDDRVDRPFREQPSDPTTWLRQRVVALDRELDALRRAAIPHEADRMRLEARDLRARLWAKDNAPSLVAEAARIRRLEAIERAMATCDTNAITAESSRLTVRYVTDALRADFAREMKNLNPSRVAVRIVQRGGRGSTYHRLQLATTTTLSAKVGEVVSDGEFRAVALANFFAEIAHATTKSAIVLDDPVTSLDHLYRARVAARLVQESGTRQVIVFTHDLVFLQDIVSAADSQGQPVSFRRLSLTRTHVGWPESEQPWDGMKVGPRAQVLQISLNQLRSQFQNGDLEAYERGVERWYSKLRSTWERAVEEILFVDAIGRYRSQVKTNNLTSLKVWILDESDVAALDSAMTKASALIDAHDAPAALNRPVPEPDELRDDLKFLQDWIANMKTKRR
jgi:energy-coupling factor transporter ATP-binding protein EcfA2